MPPPCRILYVDDDKDSRELVGTMLHFADPSYEVAAIESSEEAISLMAKQSFDLFIIDYALPEITGVELCRYIRKNNPDKPIMFLTAMAYPADREEGLKAGADEYLVKPNDVERIIETVNRLLDKSPSANCKTPNKSKVNKGIY